MDNEKFMLMALQEARMSFRTGGEGYGAVIVKYGEILSSARDSVDKKTGVRSHAENNVLQVALQKTDGDLSECILLSTFQPGSACMRWAMDSGIRHFVIGYSSLAESDSICTDFYREIDSKIVIERDILSEECHVLYHPDVRREILRLRNAQLADLKHFNDLLAKKRIQWFREHRERFGFLHMDSVESAYRLLLARFGIDRSEAPIVRRIPNGIVFHSGNFCPTLEACKILDLDTRFVCKWYNENSTDTLVKQVNGKLRFSRNYEKLRPYAEYCEEMIFLEE